MKKFNRILSFLMVLCLISSLVLPVLAAEYDLTQGSVTIDATVSESGGTTQTVTHGSNAPVEDAAPVVTSNGQGTSNTVTVNAEAGADASVTLEDTYIDADGTNKAAVTITTGSGATVTIELEGTTAVSGDYSHAGIETTGDGMLIIQDTDEDGILNAQGGHYAAGIGGPEGNYDAATGPDHAGDSSAITINGGTITAEGGAQSAGIGGGRFGDGNNITINGGTVTATSGGYGAGIGGGTTGSGTNITINGGTVIASDDASAAGIGGGGGSLAFPGTSQGSNITITGGNVTATGGTNGGAGIGGGTLNDGYNIIITGGTVTATGGIIGGAGIGGGGFAGGGTYPGGNGYDIFLGEYAEVNAQGGNEAQDIGDGAGALPRVIPDPTPIDPAPVDPAPVDPTPVDPAPVVTGESESVNVEDTFWYNVITQLRAAKRGDTITVNAGWRTTMPVSVMEAIAETGVTLVIQWSGGDDITIDKPYDGEKKYWEFSFYQLPDLLAD